MCIVSSKIWRNYLLQCHLRLSSGAQKTNRFYVCLFFSGLPERFYEKQYVWTTKWLKWIIQHNFSIYFWTFAWMSMNHIMGPWDKMKKKFFITNCSWYFSCSNAKRFGRSFFYYWPMKWKQITEIGYKQQWTISRYWTHKLYWYRHISRRT